jgi:hypothetical protein
MPSQSPLDHYHRRDRVDDRQYRAGDRFRTDFLLGGLETRLVADLARISGNAGGGPGLMATERQVAARQRWRRATQAVGLRLSPVLVAVCCEERTAADWTAKPGRGGEIEGMTTLRLALDTLADHYGF